jgi:hypothetical protein
MSKKIIKLNESDIEGLINRILRESDGDSDEIIINTLIDCTEETVEIIYDDLNTGGGREGGTTTENVAKLWVEELTIHAPDGFDECGVSTEEFYSVRHKLHQAMLNHLNEMNGINESTEDKFLNMLVENTIKEEGEEDNPKDVEKFLELADNYLFQKFGKFAEKINTTKEKAMLIASLAKKWGVEPEQLGKVKSILNTESKNSVNEWNPFKKKGGYDKSTDDSRSFTKEELFSYLRNKYNVTNQDININMGRPQFEKMVSSLINNNKHNGGDSFKTPLRKAANELHGIMRLSESRKPINEVNINKTVRKIKARGKAEDYEIERVLDYVRKKVGGSLLGNTIQSDTFTITAGNTGFNVRRVGGRKMMFDYDQIGNMAKFLKESKLDEAGGYDDPTIMGQHAGTVMGILKTTVKGIVMGTLGLEQLIEKGGKGEIMSNIQHLTGAIDEGIKLMETVITDFTEEDLIKDTKILMGKLGRFNRKLRVLEGMGHGYGETDFMSELLNMSLELNPHLMSYVKSLGKADRTFVSRLGGRDQGHYGDHNDYFNN